MAQQWLRDAALPAEPPDFRTLVLMAQEVMNRLLFCFSEQGVTPPSRQLVYMAPIPADCEQVAVLFSGWTPLPGWDTFTKCDNFRWCANLSVIITRCTPAIAKNPKMPPTVEQMLEAAQISSADAEVLLSLVSSIGEIGSDLEMNTPAPQGGMQTVELNIMIPAAGGLD